MNLAVVRIYRRCNGLLFAIFVLVPLSCGDVQAVSAPELQEAMARTVITRMPLLILSIGLRNSHGKTNAFLALNCRYRVSVGRIWALWFPIQRICRKASRT